MALQQMIDKKSSFFTSGEVCRMATRHVLSGLAALCVYLHRTLYLGSAIFLMRTKEMTSKCMCDSTRGRSAVRFVKNCPLKLTSD